MSNQDLSENNIIELQDKVLSLLKRLPNHQIPNFSASRGSLLFNGDPLDEIWFEDGKWYWKETERGQLRFETSYSDEVELITRIIEMSISEMAWRFELNNRVENQDSRRIAFAYHDMLFTILGEPYISHAHLFYQNNRYNGKFSDLHDELYK